VAIDAVGIDVQPPETYQYNWFNQLVAVADGSGGATTYGYDGNGNQVSRTNAAGTTSYAYNYDNRLVGISGPGGASYFEYDANGLRTKKSDSTGTRSYLLDGLSVVAEYAPDASKLAWYTRSLARIDEVLSVVNSTGKYWYESDALGSTYAMTSTAGAVVSRSSYDVFGERSLAAGIDLGQPFGFTGREHDLSGLVYARARYLSPATGRWTSRDRLAFVDGPNLFLYARARPTVGRDPSGTTAVFDARSWEGHLDLLSRANHAYALLEGSTCARNWFKLHWSWWGNPFSAFQTFYYYDGGYTRDPFEGWAEIQSLDAYTSFWTKTITLMPKAFKDDRKLTAVIMHELNNWVAPSPSYDTYGESGSYTAEAVANSIFDQQCNESCIED
jgi:RHS repeat-associated protein